MRLKELPQRIATQAERLPNGGLRVRIQKELKNHNSGAGGGNRHGHWSGRHRERQEWRSLIINALVDGLGFGQTLHLVGPGSNLPGAIGGLQCHCEIKPGQKTKRCHCPETLKRRLLIARWVPSTRHYAKDRVNKFALAKLAQDSVKSLGLLRDDSDKWCDLDVQQHISPDGLFWTEFLIEPIALPQREDIAC